MLRHNHRIKGGVAVAGYIQGNFTKIGLQGLATESIAAVTAVFTCRIVLGITGMQP